jgi:hypothetical protein
MAKVTDVEKHQRRQLVWKLWLNGNKDAASIGRKINVSTKTVESDIEFLKKTEVPKLKGEGFEMGYVEAVRRAELQVANLTDMLAVAQRQALVRGNDSNGAPTVLLDRDWIFPLMELQRNLNSTIKYLNELRGVNPSKKVEVQTKTIVDGQITINGFGEPMALEKAEALVEDIQPDGGWDSVPPEVIYPSEGPRLIEDFSDDDEQHEAGPDSPIKTEES